MLENLALSDVYKRRIDDKTRVVFPSNFREEITKKVGSGYYLFLEIEDTPKRLRIVPISKTEYDKKVAEMDSIGKADPERRRFFRQFTRELDHIGRMTLTKLLLDLLDYQIGDTVYFKGFGDYCELFKASEDELMLIIQGKETHPTL